jgi:hypothetical protein
MSGEPREPNWDEDLTEDATSTKKPEELAATAILAMRHFEHEFKELRLDSEDAIKGATIAHLALGAFLAARS